MIKGSFLLTFFGSVVYNAQLVTEAGVKNNLKLETIDSNRQSSGRSAEDEEIQLIKTILNGNTIERVLAKQV